MKIVDTTSLTKLYYSIGEVAELFDISASLIRYWESEFTYLKPHKNSKGDRRFTKENIAQLELIYNLVKVKGFTLEGAKNAIKDQRHELETKSQIANTLNALRAKLKDMRDKLVD